MKAIVFDKVFFLAFILSTELLEDKQYAKLGELIRLKRIYFSKEFCYCFASDLHDLYRTNPD